MILSLNVGCYTLKTYTHRDVCLAGGSVYQRSRYWSVDFLSWLLKKIKREQYKKPVQETEGFQLSCQDCIPLLCSNMQEHLPTPPAKVSSGSCSKCAIMSCNSLKDWDFHLHGFAEPEPTLESEILPALLNSEPFLSSWLQHGNTLTQWTLKPVLKSYC